MPIQDRNELTTTPAMPSQPSSAHNDFFNGLVFGFDVGTASIGWAVRKGPKFLDVGVLICPEQRCYLASSNCGFLRRRFMSTTSLRMQATSATFGFLPAARSFK